MECEVREKKNHNEGMRSKGKIKQSHGGGVFMVKPTQRLEVIKKTQSHKEWVESEGGKRTIYQREGGRSGGKKITWREWEVRKRTMSQGTSTKWDFIFFQKQWEHGAKSLNPSPKSLY